MSTRDRQHVLCHHRGADVLRHFLDMFFSEAAKDLCTTVGACERIDCRVKYRTVLQLPADALGLVLDDDNSRGCMTDTCDKG
jgi:hypothetical protein